MGKRKPKSSPRQPRRERKTESTYFRLPEKTKYELALLSRFWGQSMAQVVERAVDAFIEQTPFEDHTDPTKGSRPWEGYWHHNPGVRMFKMLYLGGLKTTTEEDAYHEFLRHHEKYFVHWSTHTDPNGTVTPVVNFRVPYIELLWERMKFPDGELYVHWHDHRFKDFRYVEHEIESALTEAHLEVPA